MTKREYVICQAKLDAINRVLEQINKAKEEAEERDNPYSEYQKVYNAYEADVWQVVYDAYFNKVKVLRAAYLRAIAEYAVDHPHDIF